MANVNAIANLTMTVELHLMFSMFNLINVNISTYLTQNPHFTFNITHSNLRMQVSKKSYKMLIIGNKSNNLYKV